MENKITVSICPHCNSKLKVMDTRANFVYDFATVKRRRKCKNCDFKISTIEIPELLVNDIFKE